MLDLNKASHPCILEMKQGIEENDYSKVVSCLGNTLELPSLELVKDIEDIKQEMLELGFDGALMSGSGSCVFGMTLSEEKLEEGYQYFKNKYNFVRKTKILTKEEKKY